MSTGTFIGRFKHSDAIGAQARSCSCSQDENLHMSSGLPAEEAEAKKRREEEEAAERERQAREDTENAQQQATGSHTPPSHPHIPGEAYGIQMNLGDQRGAMKQFLEGVKKKYSQYWRK